MTDYKWFVLIENSKIKEYLFSNSRLKAIKGATYILDKLNTNITEKIYKKYPETAKKVYFAGGNVKVFFKNHEDAEEFLKEVESEYNRRAFGSRLVSGIFEYKEEKIFELVNRAESELKIKKKSFESYQLLPDSVIQLCEECGIFPAAEKNSVDEKYICYSCLQKISYSKNKSKENELDINNNLREKLKENGFDKIKFPENIKELSDKNNFVGFINADGNRMGEMIKAISDKILIDLKNVDSYCNIFENVSNALDSATKEAIVETIVKLGFVEKGVCKAIIIIAAGDDLVLLVPGDKAVIAACEFARIFEKKIIEKFKGIDGVKEFFTNIENVNKYRLTSGIGVVVAKSSHPIKDLFEISTQLQKSAKFKSFELYNQKKSKKKRNTKIPISMSVIDIHILKSSFLGSIKELRNSKYYKGDETGVSKTVRPFIIFPSDEFFELAKKITKIDSMEDLKELYKKGLDKHEIHNVDAFLEMYRVFNESISKSKLRQFNKFIDLDKYEASLESIRFISKIKRNEISILRDCIYKNRSDAMFPWFRKKYNWYTDIRDITEMLEFLSLDDIKIYEGVDNIG